MTYIAENNVINRKVMVDFSNSMVFATICTGISYVVGYYYGWISLPFPWLDVLAVWTSYSCTWMCVTQNYLAFPIGIVSVVAYAISFWDNHLLSSSISQWYLVPTQFVGWWYWWRGKERMVAATSTTSGNRFEWTTEEVPVTRLKLNKNLLFYIIISVAAWLVTWWITQQFHAVMAMYDSAILILSIFAQNLMQGKKIENWIIWVALNVIAIYTYFSTNLFLFGVQYLFFIVTDIIGFIGWYMDYRNQKNSI